MRIESCRKCGTELDSKTCPRCEGIKNPHHDSIL